MAAVSIPLLAEAFPEVKALADLLVERELSIAVAESCTGGLLGAALSSFPGASGSLIGGVIAYSNQVKTALLGVPEAMLAEHGAVSEPVARALAGGVRRLLGAGLGAGITGVAGPTKEDSDKPPGLVFVAVAGPAGDDMRVVRLSDDRGREGNRAAAVHAALQLLRDAIEQGDPR